MGLSPSPNTEKTLYYGGETDVIVKHNGAEMPNVAVRNLVIDHEIGRVSYATLLVDPGRLERDDARQGEPDAVVGVLKAGDSIELLAYKRIKQQSVRLFVGEVTKVKLQVTAKGASFQIEARQRCHRMTMSRRTVVYADQAETEVFKELCDRSGVNLSVETNLMQQVTTVQHNATDWDFFQMRLEAIGFHALPRLQELVVRQIDAPAKADYKFKLGDNILEFESEMDAAEQFESIETASWNDESRQFETAELDTFSQTVIGGIGRNQLGHGGGRPFDEIYNWTHAELIRRQLAEYRSMVRIYGSDIWPGEAAQLEGLGAGFSGLHLISGVRHEINQSNWTTQVQLGLDPTTFRSRHSEVTAPESAALLPGVQGLQIGIVRGLQNDPDGMHRIEVSLIAAGGNPGRIWARLATLQASNESGTFFLPDKGDEVVVGFLNGDPRDAIVLGSLYSRAYKPPLTMADANTERGYVTPKKSRIIFDEEFSSVEISVGDVSSYIYLEAGDSPGIDIVDQFGNEIKLRDQGISIQSSLDISISTTANLDLKGTNVTISADAQVKISGNAGSELSSPAVTVVKGSLVQIN